PYARRGGQADAVSEVRTRQPGPIGLWCVPEHRDGAPVTGAPANSPDSAHSPDSGAGHPRDTTVHDLSALLGPSSGALGVLQCVAATAWLTTERDTAADPDPVLVNAGSGDAGGDDASAALVLTAPAADRIPTGSRR
ncbi:hypothetical protein ACWGI8_31475, partial [Streptomyces sp. NPDC054841]